MDTRKGSYVLATFEGGGSVAPFITLARKLMARGHDVRIVSDECNRGEALASGAAFSPWVRALSRPERGRDHEPVRDWEAENGFAGICMLLDIQIVGRAEDYARDMIEILREHPADLAVVNDLILGAMMGCEALGQPFAVMGCHPLTYPVVDGMVPLGPGLPPAVTPEDRALHQDIRIGTMATFDQRLPAYNKARASVGLPPLPHLAHQIFAARRFLMATSPAYDFAPDVLPDFFAYAGPQLDDNLWSKPWTSPFATDDRRPLALVSFSTTFQDQANQLQQVVDALAALDMRSVVTLGGSIRPDEVRAAPNVHVVESAPHAELMWEASLVINHGGHGTVIKAATAGLPQLVIPHGRDQNDNAMRIVHRGAGLMLPLGADSAAIREAVQRLLDEPAFSDNARALGERIRASYSDHDIIGAVEALALGDVGKDRAEVA
ncbi:nucleotide disphospho-sugar-binding domain-containing protein [Sphingobium nicotianae]|uniref:Glycosyltransferase n=1 Tax=Sphingobium nicotianae TaxID=2782607 RepID=A0A9X1AJB3_9SPHN|nr:glycosyltransferase [Sphingobium nicotianae]MBT2185879.1 glycosyltransferase [Sphingobium nicotianae]